jgi:glycine/D-amino acid oxidase-like deaminating enzyme
VRSPSFWLETCGDDLGPRAPLDGSTAVDVAVLGAGFTGLWTAHYLLRREPGLRVAIVEREIAGFGGSGRNGGWCSSGFALGPAALRARFGPDGARRVLCAMAESVDEVGRALVEEGIDADYRKGGVLRVALGRHQAPALEAALAAYAEIGLGARWTRLNADEVRARVRVAGVRGGLFSADCARVHPGKLVRGLARAVERRGATIYEGTEATGFVPGTPARLRTAGGDVRAGTVVLAGEAYLSRLPGMRRRLLPVYSLITLTEPLGEATWAEIGWGGAECLASFRLSVDYLQRTADGRILFGGRGAPYRFGSRIRDAYDRHPPTHRMLEGMARRWFPALRGARFTHAWGGPLGVTRDWAPRFGHDRRRGLAWAYGYAGQGVAASNLAGRLLADLITGRPSALTELPVVGLPPRDWEPEPLRWLGVRYVQGRLRRIDEAAARTGVAPSGRSLAERLWRH